MKATLLLVAILAGSLFTSSFAQTNGDSTLPNHRFRVGIDILKLMNYSVKNNANERVKIELPVSFKLNNVLHLALDLGYGKGFQTAYGSTQHYNSSGFYFKPGLDVNVLKGNDKTTPKLMLLIGYRYALSFYKEKSQFIFKSKFWDTEYVEEENFNSFTSWHELLVALRINFMQAKKVGLSLGFTNRIRYKAEETDHSRLYIPGYGGNNPFNYAFNFDVAMLF